MKICEDLLKTAQENGLQLTLLPKEQSIKIKNNVKNKYLKWISIILLSILICSIGISRIYLGVHYTSDVLGGFFISISYLIIYISAVNKFFIERWTVILLFM